MEEYDETAAHWGDGPLVEVTLPDGQTIRAVVTRRRRDHSGTWWYDYQLTLLGRVDTAHGPIQQPHVVELSAPHPIVRPIEGQDYTVLDPPPPEKRTRWRVDVTRDGHRLDCVAGAEGGSLATDADALRLLAQGPEVATTCAICRPDAVLRTLPPPPDDAF
ncbi:hypothetical protein DMH15_02840 [Streptomyces sp. WAC 06725]|uniref:hypothetical protein n=1 Tax=Streptomyces sp. WAC 06725 TaxID=2203209 RepID=UPI000F73CF44|nr:hypothetical protein [Streptomyces sp. WAC 06725]RSO49626.1 hypothetical protein DMH15_02840 [Streptomyces sp. WAC 06725]